MYRTYAHFRRAAPRTIDITPGAGWRRAGRALLTLLVLVVVVPLLWLLGGLVLLALFGGVALLWAVTLARRWWRGRDAGRQRPNIIDMP